MAKHYKGEEREIYIVGIPLWLFTFCFTLADFIVCAMVDAKLWLFLLTIAPLALWSLFYYNYSGRTEK